jgi:ComF family protein
MIKPGLRLSTYLRRSVNYSQNPGSRCVLCLAPALSGRLCPGCERDLPALAAGCATCGLPLPLPTPACGGCQKQPPAFDRVQAALPYTFPVSAMISRFKYQGELAMVRPLVVLLEERLRQDGARRPELLLPCPIHPRRYRVRGFNQAAVIAARLGRALDIPVDYRLCVRPKAVAPQTGLDRAARLRNLKEAFVLKGRPPARVAIVDDVVTTTATAQQLAKTLKAGGAEDVSVWALARTPLP